jgi:ADP-ribose pyrophosphatase
MKFSLKNERIVFNDHYKMVMAKVTYDTFNGNEITTDRLAFERGNSVAIILFEKDTESVLLTHQFRYPTCKNNEGWLLEIPAGSMEENETPENCIVRETMEELGYRITAPELIHTFYTSPGASTERIFLFYAEVTQKDKTEKGGGCKSENEDIEIVKIPVSEIIATIKKLKDAKTILALQWFLLNKN